MSKDADCTVLQPSCGDEQPPASSKSGESWTISFANPKKRKVSKKEQLELQKQQQRLLVDGGEPAGSSNDDYDGAGPPDASSALNMADVLNSDEFIPRNLTTTREDLLDRLHMDIPRLLCIAKQYPRSCGITSLVSVWNFLYSRIGQGSLPPVSQEEAMTILGFYPPFDAIRWGPFTGNTTLFRWFHSLNRHFNVTGKAYYLWKVRGAGRTPGITSEHAEQLFRDTIRNPSCGIVYHCHNHYMVPVGYQMIPRHQSDCYRRKPGDEGAAEMTVFIGEVSRGKHPAMHVVKWRDVETDLNTASPQYFNIRHAELGIQTRGGKKKQSHNGDAEDDAAEASNPPPAPAAAASAASSVKRAGGGGNLHCLLVFRSDVAEEDLAQFENDPAGDGGNDVEDDDDADDAGALGDDVDV